MQGLRIGVTGARKAAQLAAALERRDADPFVGPLVTTDVPAPDEQILAATDTIIVARPDWVAASTGVGMRLWAEVAERHGRLPALQDAIAQARRVARGAKALGGFAAFECRPEHTTEQETDDAVADWLDANAQPSATIAVQEHGGEVTAFEQLRAQGHTVLAVRPYVAGRLPDDEARARALVVALAAGELDVITFTSPGAARNLFTLAAELGDETATAVDAALKAQVAVAVIGPVTADVLRQRGIPIAIQPDRHRQGELVRAIARWDEVRTARSQPGRT